MKSSTNILILALFPWTYQLDAAFYVITVIVFILLAIRQGIKFDHSMAFFLLLLWVCFLITLSINFLSSSQDILIIFREITKLLAFTALIGTIYYINSSKVEITDSSVILVLGVLLGSQIFIILLSYIGFEAAIDKIYDQTKNTHDSFGTKLRVVGTFLNPNYLAFFATLMAVVCLDNNIRRFSYFIPFIGFCSLVLLSGSRTGLIALFVVLAFSFICKLRLNAKSIFIFLLVLGLAAFFFMDFYYLLTSIKRFKNLFSLEGLMLIPAFSQRVDIWIESVEFIRASPFFGYFVSPVPITDSFYFSTMLRFGSIFSFLFFLLFMYVVRISKIGLMTKINFLLAVFLFLLTGSFFDNPKIMGIYCFIFCLVIEHNKHKHKHKHSYII